MPDNQYLTTGAARYEQPAVSGRSWSGDTIDPDMGYLDDMRSSHDRPTTAQFEYVREEMDDN